MMITRCDANGLKAIRQMLSERTDCLILSTLDGCMGEAYATPDYEQVQIINGDFVFFAGDAQGEMAQTLVKHLPEAHPSNYLLLVPQTPQWGMQIERAWGAQAKKIERHAIRKDVNHFDKAKLEEFTRALPAEITLHRIDEALYHKALAEEWSADFVRQYQSAEDFCRRGVGYMALAAGEPVAGASAYVVYNGGIEIEVDTRRDYRQQGLATACSAALILECLERGLYPSWDAATPISVALAEKLGYVYNHPYDAYEVILPEHKETAHTPG